MVGRLDLSESRSTHAMSAMQCTDWTLQGQSGKEEGGRGPSARGLLVLLFVPAAVLTQWSINSPYMLLAAAFPCWLWAEVPKITRRALHLWDIHCGGLKAACLLPAGPPVPLASQTSCGHRSPASLRCSHFPFYSSSESEPRTVESPLWAWKLCQVSSGDPCPATSL